jgi:hypothetical protein
MAYKVRIPPSILPNSRLNALDPQLVPFSLLSSPITIGVLPRFLDAPNGNPKAIFGTSLESLGLFQQVLVLRSFKSEQKESVKR